MQLLSTIQLPHDMSKLKNNLPSSKYDKYANLQNKSSYMLGNV